MKINGFFYACYILIGIFGGFNWVGFNEVGVD
jgi:hypothetical protein